MAAAAPLPPAGTHMAAVPCEAGVSTKAAAVWNPCMLSECCYAGVGQLRHACKTPPAWPLGRHAMLPCPCGVVSFWRRGSWRPAPCACMCACAASPLHFPPFHPPRHHGQGGLPVRHPQVFLPRGRPPRVGARAQAPVHAAEPALPRRRRGGADRPDQGWVQGWAGLRGCMRCVLPRRGPAVPVGRLPRHG